MISYAKSELQKYHSLASTSLPRLVMRIFLQLADWTNMDTISTPIYQNVQSAASRRDSRPQVCLRRLLFILIPLHMSKETACLHLRSWYATWKGNSMLYVVIGLHPCGMNKSNTYGSCRNNLNIPELPAIKKLRGNRCWCIKIPIKAKIQNNNTSRKNIPKYIICSTYFHFTLFWPTGQPSEIRSVPPPCHPPLPSTFPSLNHPTPSYLYPLTQDIAPGTYAVSSTSEDIERAFCALLSVEVGEGWGSDRPSTPRISVFAQRIIYRKHQLVKNTLWNSANFPGPMSLASSTYSGWLSSILQPGCC